MSSESGGRAADLRPGVLNSSEYVILLLNEREAIYSRELWEFLSARELCDKFYGLEEGLTVRNIKVSAN